MRHVAFFTVMLMLFHYGGTALAEEPENNPAQGVPKDIDTKLPIGPILLGSFGVAVIALGAGFGWQAWEENDDFNKKDEKSSQGGNPVYPLATDDLADDIKAHAIIANVLLFGGTAVVIGSVLWWILDDDYDQVTETEGELELSKVKWRPEIGPGTVGLKIEF